MVRIISLLTLLASLFSCSPSSSAYTNLDVAAFAEKTQEKGIVIVDIRTADEYADGHLVDAVNIDWYSRDFMTKIEAAYPATVPLAIYCRSGRRSAAAAAKLSKAGYEVYNMLGGYIAWTKAEMETTKE
jgi:rhodanese-related sulfurtransferase